MKHKSKLNEHIGKWDGMGPLLNIEELEDEDLRMISAEVFENIKNNEGDMHEQYFLVLAKYKIMCPHPQNKRLYSNKKLSYHSISYPWYECSMCDSAVINKEYVKEEADEKDRTQKVY